MDIITLVLEEPTFFNYWLLKKKYFTLQSLLLNNNIFFYNNCSSWTKCLNNLPCDVIKMREMRGEVGKNGKK